MNSISVVGIVMNDVRQANNGKIANFSISDRFGSERQIVECVAFNTTAEYIIKMVKKGNAIAVNGVLTLKPYTNKDGKEVKQTKVIVNGFELLKDNAEYKKDYREQKQEEVKPAPTEINIDDDMLPF